MRNIKAKTAVLTIAAAMLLTACSSGEGTSLPDLQGEGSTSGNTSMDIPGLLPPKPVKKLGMWDVLPEIPVTDASAFTYEYDSELGGMVVTDYLRESPKVRIPDTLEGEPVVEVHLGIKKEITELIMPDSVTKFGLSDKIIGSLQYVNIPESIAGGAVPYMAFQGGVNLKSVYLPDSVTAIDAYAFNYCPNVAITYKGKTYDHEHLYLLYDYLELGGKDLIIENGVLKDVSMELTEVVIPDGVTEIERNAFLGCQNLTSVTIPDSMTEIGDYTFNDCASLTSVTIPDSVTEIGGSAFSGCTSLKNLTIPNGVTKINDYTFNDCTSLTSITIPDSVTEIGGSAFSGCTSLTSVTIPDSVTEIGGYAFAGCTSLTSVAIPDSVTKINHSTFEGCTSLSSVTYKDKTYDYENIDLLYDYIELGGQDLIIENGVLKNVSQALTEVVIPDSVTEIGDSAFYECKGLTSVIIPDSVTKIGGWAFSGCSSLTSVTIPDSVTEIGKRAFCNCSSLTSVTLPDSVTTIGYEAFWGCTSLTSVTLPNNAPEIDSSAFKDCTNLTSVIYNGKTFENIDQIYDYIELGGQDLIIENGVLKDVSISLTEVIIPDGVTEIDFDAFEGCTKLTSVTIPDSVVWIGACTFYDCKSITNLTYKGKTYDYEHPGDLYYAFYGD